MKNNRKKTISTIISKTLIFVVVVLLVTMFKSLFGEENSLVGVTSIVLMLVLLQRDLAVRPVRNLIYLIGFNLFLGVFSFLAVQNIWTGVIINFGVMFLIAYLFSYELRNPVNMFFGLHYMLMLTSPVAISDLPMRLVSLVFASFMIMAAQILANRNKLVKLSDTKIEEIESCTLEKINLLSEKSNVEEINSVIDDKINELKITIYDSGRKQLSISRQGRKITNILACLEKINILLDGMMVQEVSEELFNDIYNQLSNIKNDKFNYSDMEVLIEKYNEKNISIVDEFAGAFRVLNNQTHKLKNLPETHRDIKDNEDDIHEDFKGIKVKMRSFKLESNRVAYGVRLGVLVALTVFLTGFFKLEYGNWMLYTVFALTQPYEEYTKIKSRKRLIGTIIGALIVFVLFNIVKDPGQRTIILILAGYLMSYVSDYRDMVIFITLSSICSAALSVQDPNPIIASRVFYVIVGIVLALIANRVILKRKYEDEAVNLNKIQDDMVVRLTEEISNTKEVNKNTINSLFLITGFLEKKVDMLKLNIEKSVLYKNKILINDLYCDFIIESLAHDK